MLIYSETLNNGHPEQGPHLNKDQIITTGMQTCCFHNKTSQEWPFLNSGHKRFGKRGGHYSGVSLYYTVSMCNAVQSIKQDTKPHHYLHNSKYVSLKATVTHNPQLIMP